MAHLKDQHYWAQLRATLTSGQWSSSSPAKATNGSPLSWSELLRKFNKHCRGFGDISQIAAHTQTLAILLRANSKDDDQDDAYAEEEWPMSLGSTCTLPEERKEEARVAYDALIKLECNHYDTLNMALAYYAYALGDPRGCIAHLEKIPSLINVQSHIPSLASVPSADSLHPPPSSSGPTTDGSSVSWTGSFLSDGTATQPVSADVKDGTAWALTETLRSICLQGMAYEDTRPASPDRATEAYNAALPLITNILSDLSPQTGQKSPGPSSYSFTSSLVFGQHRELWRWVDLLIWRSVCLLSRISNVHDEADSNMLWKWLKQYSACTAIWPPDFRTQHRSTISVLYLRALALRAQGRGPASLTYNDAQQRHPYGNGHQEENKQWISSARSIVNNYQAILSVSTRFPSAGQTNVKVEDFVDLCVAVWEAGGSAPEQATWVVDVLWWATRLTFNSPRILRHMSRLFYASGDISLAKRTLQVYVQVVSKALEANQSGADKETDSDVNWILTTTNGARMLARIATAEASGRGWFDGANGNTSRPTTIKEGAAIDDAREAATLVMRAKERLKGVEKALGEDSSTMRELRKRVDLAEGVVLSVLALAEQEPLTRDKIFHKAHSALVQAASYDDGEEEEQTASTSKSPQSSSERQASQSISSSAHFHLSLSFSRPGPKQDMPRAIVHAGRALVGDQQNIRYWHLLGLLLAATESWEEAREALEQGARIGEDERQFGQEKRDSSGLPTPEESAPPSTLTVSANGANGTNGLGTTRTVPEGLPRSHGHSDRPEPATVLPPVHHSPSRSLTASSATTAASRKSNLVPSYTLLGPLPDHPQPTQQESLEHALQLRMTQMALTEYTDGAEAAEALGVQVFLWAGRKRGTNTTSAPGSVRPDQPRSSIGSRPFTDSSGQAGNDVPSASRSVEHLSAVPPSLVIPQSEPPQKLDRRQDLSEKLIHVPPPIKITPTTPEQEASRQSLTLASLHDEKERDGEGSNGVANGTAVNEKAGDPGQSPVQSQRSHDLSRSKKVQQLLKSQVHKGHETIKKIGSGVAKTGGSLRRANSTPDFHALLKTTHYQASSIHSRKRIGALIRRGSHARQDSPPPPSPSGLQPSALPGSPSSKGSVGGVRSRSRRENRVVSDLWLMCAATFRRSGKIEQAKGAIQEAEVIDEDNPAVWVQLGIYYSALGKHLQAAETFQKALFLAPDDVPAAVHLCRLWLTEPSASRNHSTHQKHHCQQGREGSAESEEQVERELVDLSSGILSHLTKGPGWDVPEAWYYLAKAYGIQGRKEKQKECLKRALELSHYRGVREVGAAVGWCL